MKFLLYSLLLLLPFYSSAQKSTPQEVSRFEQQAKRVTIIRDKWGVPHIYGQTDANAVFGLMYSQCEENFKGIEQNYLYQLGKQTQGGAKNALYTDIQLQLIADSADAIKEYKASPLWFKKLMDAFADGINYYLYKHPEQKPLVLTHFEPWYALMFTDGSVAATSTGGITLTETERFYGDPTLLKTSALSHHSLSIEEQVFDRETGSNGFAISPSKSASGHAMLYINPHVPFYFRSEVQMISNDGLNVYGAVTWGQFFVYQGFNQHCGWMHTSSNADVADLYAEMVIQKDGRWMYEYDGKLKPVTTRKLVLYEKQGNQLKQIIKTGYYTHHGPVVGSRDGKWLALKHNNRSYNALLESWLITKANTFAQYKKAMDLLSNTTNNTVYADDQGNTAFWYGNFVPRRRAGLDWTQPVDGSTSETEWKGLHPLSEIIQVINPKTGWIQNCNSTPFASSGSSSPKADAYPAYMGPDGENFRGVRAAQILSMPGKLNIDDMIGKGYDHYLTAFFMLLPHLFVAYGQAPDSLKVKLKPAIDTLKQWNKQSSVSSIATTLATEYATLLFSNLPRPASSEAGTYQINRVAALIATTTNKQQLDWLNKAIVQLESKYGTWQIPLGSINRYQRLAEGKFDDNQPSIPVGAVASTFGQLPSFVSRIQNGTTKRYGYSGNSFIAAVEFGPQIKAKSIITGGQSFNSESPNFTNQAQRYIDGNFKDVLFYKPDVIKHQVMSYHPGEAHKGL